MKLILRIILLSPTILTQHFTNCKPQYSFSTNHNPKFLLFNYTQKSRHIIGDSIINFILYLKTSFVLILESDYFNNSIISSSLFDNDLEISSKLIPFVSIALIPCFITWFICSICLFTSSTCLLASCNFRVSSFSL